MSSSQLSPMRRTVIALIPVSVLSLAACGSLPFVSAPESTSAAPEATAFLSLPVPAPLAKAELNCWFSWASAVSPARPLQSSYGCGRLAKNGACIVVSLNAESRVGPDRIRLKPRRGRTTCRRNLEETRRNGGTLHCTHIREQQQRRTGG